MHQDDIPGSVFRVLSWCECGNRILGSLFSVRSSQFSVMDISKNINLFLMK
jgi:hypothetical protein